jgi:hypothetical protein
MMGFGFYGFRGMGFGFQTHFIWFYGYEFSVLNPKPYPNSHVCLNKRIIIFIILKYLFIEI